MPDSDQDRSKESQEAPDDRNADLFEAPGTDAPGQQSLWEVTETPPPRIK
jgi:hypothetical protein